MKKDTVFVVDAVKTKHGVSLSVTLGPEGQFCMATTVKQDTIPKTLRALADYLEEHTAFEWKNSQ